jgi:hypothetical protein
VGRAFCISAVLKVEVSSNDWYDHFQLKEKLQNCGGIFKIFYIQKFHPLPVAQVDFDFSLLPKL